MNYTGKELFFNKDDLIVSKTDLKGKITYANDIFLDIAGYTEQDVIGQPHNIIRNPNMPRVIFEFLWRKISSGNEIFAFVVNSAKNGDHYWVIAHVTPSMKDGNIIGYHSTRRVPDANTIRTIIEPLYSELKSIEDSASNRKEGIQKSLEHFEAMLARENMSYDEFIASLH
jgi:PAS domain S-box-containing protein